MRSLSAEYVLPGRHRAFSLVELLAVCSLTALLLSLAIPSMGAMLGAQRVSSLTLSFVASLHLTRSEAIKRNGRAVMCKSADGQQCASLGGWEQGWVVFHDINNNAQVDPGEWVAQRHGPFGPGIELRGNAPVANYVSYSAAGTAKMLSGAFQAGTFTLCPAGQSAASGGPVRRIVLGHPGRPRVQAGTPEDCA